jgi:hypothetical protein
MSNGIAEILQELHVVGMHTMNNLTYYIRKMAPEPGSLVYVESRRLSLRPQQFEPTLFSAIDICTHLQIARIYLTPSLGSAIDFVDHIRDRYPFPISEIRTGNAPPFGSPATFASHNRLTATMEGRGIKHTLIIEPHRDPVLASVVRLTFGGVFEGSLDQRIEENLIDELIRFLFFHNNHRALPTLGGLTPIMRLREFDDFKHLRLFEPESSERHPDH